LIKISAKGKRGSNCTAHFAFKPKKYTKVRNEMYDKFKAHLAPRDLANFLSRAIRNLTLSKNSYLKGTSEYISGFKLSAGGAPPLLDVGLPEIALRDVILFTPLFRSSALLSSYPGSTFDDLTRTEVSHLMSLFTHFSDFGIGGIGVSGGGACGGTENRGLPSSGEFLRLIT
jgi:hypothetical protein